MSFGSTIVVNKFCYLMMSSTENCACPNFFPSKKTQNGIIIVTEKGTYFETKYKILPYVSFCLGILTTNEWSRYAVKKKKKWNFPSALDQSNSYQEADKHSSTFNSEQIIFIL